VQLVRQEGCIGPAVALATYVQWVLYELWPVSIELCDELVEIIRARPVVLRKVLLLCSIREANSGWIINEEQVSSIVPAIGVFNEGVRLKGEKERPDALKQANHRGDARAAIEPDRHWICGRIAP